MVPSLSQTILGWFGSVIAEQVRATPDPAVAELEKQVMAMKETVAALVAKVDEAVAKINADNAQVASLTADVAAKAGEITDLQGQLATAQANASDPADEAAVADATAKLDAALNPPAPPATEANPS